MGKRTTSSLINYHDNELDQAIADAIEHFAQCNIRFRSPNRNVGPTHKHKISRPAREN